MANSSTVSSGDLATAAQYNNLRSDVLDTSSGHLHDGSNGRGDGAFILQVAGLPITIENSTDNVSNQVMLLRGDNATRADGDEIYVSFNLDDDGGNTHEFARITAEAVDVSNGSEDGQFRFGVTVAGTMTDVFTINSSTGGATSMTLDVSGDLTLDADGGDILFKDGGTTFGSATNTGGNLILKSGTTTAATFSGANVTLAGTVGSGAITSTGIIKTDDATEATSTTDGSLQTDGGLSVVKDAVFGDDVFLLSDSAVFNMGAGNDFTITHDGTTGATIAGNPLTLDSGADITLDAEGADIFLKDGGTLYGTLTNSSGQLVIKSSSSGTTAATFSGANVTLAGTVASGAITSSGIIKTDDATEATSTTDGSLQTDGGLSVVKDAVFGDDVFLLSDSAVLNIGADSDAKLTHDGTTGLTISANPIILDAGGDITLDADGGDVIFKDGGTTIATLTNSSSDFVITTGVQDKDFIIKGDDGGSAITALTIDMSDAGRAQFNNDVRAGADLEVLGTLIVGTNANEFSISESSDDITIKSLISDKDLKISGNDGGSNIDALSFDMSAAGKATFNNEIVSGAVITSGAGLLIADDGTIGSASDNDAIAISSAGVVTMNQIPVFSAGINVSGGTITGTIASGSNSQTNITALGTLTALSGGTGDLIWDTNLLHVDVSDSQVGIGVANALTKFHVRASDASASVASAEVIATFERNGHGYLQMLNTTSTEGGILFGDADDADIGSMVYKHSTNGFHFRTNATSNRFEIQDDGNIIGTHGTYHESSDQRVKKEIATISGALNKVAALRGVNFKWKDTDKGTALKMGLIAQETEAVVPEVVNTASDTFINADGEYVTVAEGATPPSGVTGIKAVNYQVLVGLLIEAIKELKTTVDAL